MTVQGKTIRDGRIFTERPAGTNLIENILLRMKFALTYSVKLEGKNE